MPRLKFVVDRVLDDGRFVIVNSFSTAVLLAPYRQLAARFVIWHEFTCAAS